MMVFGVVGRDDAAMFSAEFTNAASAMRSIVQPTALREYTSKTSQQKKRASFFGCSEISVAPRCADKVEPDLMIQAVRNLRYC